MDKGQQEFSWADAARPKMTIDASENHPGVVIQGDTAIATKDGTTIIGSDGKSKAYIGFGEAGSLSASDKPEIADKPSFLKDVKNGLVHALQTIWAVPEARGKIATLLVRVAVPLLPAGVGTLATILIETLAK